MFAAVLFLIAKKWKQYPAMGKLLTQTMYIHTMEQYYAAIKQTIDKHNNLDESLNYAEWGKKPFPKDYILYDSIYISFLK